MPTIKDIAKILNISSGTVSKGLNDASDISEDLRNKILETAISIGYTSKRMRKIENRTLCIFIQNMDYSSTNQFGYEVILGFKQLALPGAFHVDIVNVTPHMLGNESYDTYMMKYGYLGGFFIGFTLEDSWIHQLATTKVPTVLLDNEESLNTKVAYLGTDNVAAFDQAIAHFQSLGHTQIAFINGDKDSMISNKRALAFQQALQRYHLPTFPNQMVYGNYSQEGAKAYIPEFIKKGVTAVMCGSDIMAMGVISEYTRLGYQIPQDISVIGYDDLPLSAHLSPPLTSIKQDRGNLGKLAFTTLLSLMHNVQISQTLLRPTFVLRSSTGEYHPITKKE